MCEDEYEVAFYAHERAPFVCEQRLLVFAAGVSGSACEASGARAPALEPLALHSAQPGLRFTRSSLTCWSSLHSACLIPAS
jgi:hypothetical protein